MPESFDSLLWVTLRDGVYNMMLIDGAYRFIVTKTGDLSFHVDLPTRPAQALRIPPDHIEDFYSFIRAIIQLRDVGVGLAPGKETTGTELEAVQIESGDTDETSED